MNFKSAALVPHAFAVRKRTFRPCKGLHAGGSRPSHAADTWLINLTVLCNANDEASYINCRNAADIITSPPVMTAASRIAV
jgi:hypothetical protein